MITASVRSMGLVVGLLGSLGVGSAGCAPGQEGPDELSFPLIRGEAKEDGASQRTLRARVVARPQLEVGRWFEGELRASSDGADALRIDAELFEVAASEGFRIDLIGTASKSAGTPGLGLALFTRRAGERAWTPEPAFEFTSEHGLKAMYNVYEAVELDGQSLRTTTRGWAPSSRAVDANVEYGLFPVVAEVSGTEGLRLPYAVSLGDLR